MAGVALGDIDVSFAWHIHAASESISLKYDFVTHNFVFRLAWQAWHLPHTHTLSHTHTKVECMIDVPVSGIQGSSWALETWGHP